MNNKEQIKFSIAFMMVIIGIIYLINIASACSTDNSLVVGQNMTICTSNCVYRNESNQSQFVECDSSVNCKITIFYPNETLNVAYEGMNFILDHFEYNLTSNTTGEYSANINCYRTKGWFNKDFKFTVNNPGSITITEGSSGGSRSGPTYDTYSVCSLIKEYISARKSGSGIFEYNQTNIKELNNKLQNQFLGNLGDSEIENYIKNYNQKCKEVGEFYFTPMYITGTSIKVEESFSIDKLWKDYKYLIIFITVLVIGIIFFETKRRNKSKKILEQKQ